MTRTLVIKVGTKVLADAQGNLDLAIIRGLAGQIAELKAAGDRVVLVSSGAVGAGRTLVVLPLGRDETAARQVYAAVGQAKLMSLYADSFAPHGLVCAQVLATKEDFRDQAHYFNMLSCFENLLHDDILPIVNENDVVAGSELLFTDNDELAGLVASLLGADGLVILSSIAGLVGADGQVIRRVTDAELVTAEAAVRPATSQAGRGGMVTKFAVARRLAAQGIVVYIGDGRHPQAIRRLLEAAAGTCFEPALKKAKAGKRRLAHAGGLTRGAAHVDAEAASRLLSGAAASLLPVGVTHLEGNFAEGDIIEIRDPDGKRLGFGRATCDAATASRRIGEQNVPPLVHYDHMFIE